MIQIVYSIPENVARNATVRQALMNVGYFIRDLWAARSPSAGGGYVMGLMQAGSVKLEGGQLRITNFAKHAAVIEHGFSSYNWGMRTLNKGKNVQFAADGSRYKIIKIDEKPTARYRRPSVAQAVTNSFAKLAPLGMKPGKMVKYGQLDRYKPRKALQRPIKGGPPRKDAPLGFFVVSEKAIKNSGGRAWQMPDREGYHLAEKVKGEAKALVIEAVRSAMQMEKNRQKAVGRRPGWSGARGISQGRVKRP